MTAKLRIWFARWVISVIVISVIGAITEGAVKLVEPESRQRFHELNGSFVRGLQRLDPNECKNAYISALYSPFTPDVAKSTSWTERIEKNTDALKAAVESVIGGGLVSIVMAVVVLSTGFMLVRLVVQARYSHDSLGKFVGYVFFVPVYGAVFISLLIKVVTFVDQSVCWLLDTAGMISALNLTFPLFGCLLWAVFEERKHHFTSKVTESIVGKH